MKRKILIITTKNCLGCTILINNIQTVLAKSKKDITLEIKDFNEVPKRILHKYSAFDYPFVVFTRDDEVTFKFTGSTHFNVIQRYVDLYL